MSYLVSNAWSMLSPKVYEMSISKQELLMISLKSLNIIMFVRDRITVQGAKVQVWLFEVAVVTQNSCNYWGRHRNESMEKRFVENEFRKNLSVNILRFNKRQTSFAELNVETFFPKKSFYCFNCFNPTFQVP
jgi:hypothetical protein